MLVPWPRDEAGTYLAVVAFLGTIFFAFLNFALLANCWSSGRRLGLDSATSSSVRLSSESSNCWPLSKACRGGTITVTRGAPASVESCTVHVLPLPVVSVAGVALARASCISCSSCSFRRCSSVRVSAAGNVQHHYVSFLAVL